MLSPSCTSKVETGKGQSTVPAMRANKVEPMHVTCYHAVMEICGNASQIDLAFPLAREMEDEHQCRCGYVDFIDGPMRAAECVRASCINNFGFSQRDCVLGAALPFTDHSIWDT